MKSICFSVITFVTILEIVNSLSISKDAQATDEKVNADIKQHFTESSAPSESLNHEMKRSLNDVQPRSERFLDLGSWFGNRQPNYYPNRPYYPQGGGAGGYYPQAGGGYYPQGGSGYYPGAAGGGGAYPGGAGYPQNGVGTNFLGNGGGYGGNGGGYGGYGGFGGNGNLATYYGYNVNDYDLNSHRNTGYGYYRGTNLDGVPNRKNMGYMSSSPGNGGYRGYD